MARAKYDPLKSNRSSFGKRPKLTWSDKRSGDSVGKGLKRGSYQAWTAYHSSPKKIKLAKSTRSSSSTRSTHQSSTSGVARSSVQSDLAVLRKITEIFKNSAAAESSAEETSESTAAKGSEVLSPEVLRELRGETSPSDDTSSSDNTSPSEETSPRDAATFEPPVNPDRLLFNNTQPKNTDHCPHCGFVFPKVPKRGRACENCGQKFVVRSNCVLYNSIFLTPEESVASDYFTRLSYSIDHADKLAKRLLSENPDLSPGELFMQMIEANGSKGHSIYDNTLEQESWLYQMVAEYEEKCGRKTSDLHQRAVAASRAKAKEYQKIDKMFDDISAGKIDIWK